MLKAEADRVFWVAMQFDGKLTFLTVAARWLVAGLIMISTLPLAPIVFLATGLGGVLIAIPAVGTVVALSYDLLWIIPERALLATSWLWERVPLCRLVLLVPGVALAWLAYTAASLTPMAAIVVGLGMNPVEARWEKEWMLKLCDHWPLSLSFYRMNQEARARAHGGVGGAGSTPTG
jgi:hypothetical protein